MIEFQKLNGEPILINPYQIEYIEVMPESRVVMMNGKFHIVSESRQQIKDAIEAYFTRIHTHKED